MPNLHPAYSQQINKWPGHIGALFPRDDQLGPSDREADVAQKPAEIALSDDNRMQSQPVEMMRASWHSLEHFIRKNKEKK